MAESSTNGLGGGETTHQLYLTAVRKCEALKEEYEALHKRYADLMSSHGATVSQLEVSQEEQSCLRKRYDDVCMELKGALRERNGLQQQCTAAIRQWDNALRERNEAKEQLSKVQQQRDEAMKEITNAMAFRIKATKDLSRLAEERNATFKEYSLVMSERDTVHKEIERLQEELGATAQKLQLADSKRKAAFEEIESLRREIAAVLQDRDQALKQCNDLKEKYGDASAGLLGSDSRCDWSSSQGDRHWDKVLDSQRSERSEGSLNHGGSSLSSWEQIKGSSSKGSQRLDDLDQANREIESLRRLSDRLQVELTEAQQEAEVCKRRRDWAFSERDKIVLERESIRTLCDKLRRERDRAVSDLAEALRDSDDVKRQKNDTLKELKELREKMEAQLEKESRLKQLHSVGGSNNYSRDSAIDADLQEGDSETLDITLRDFTMANPGFDVTKGSDLLYPGESQNGMPQVVVVSSITKGSAADGRLRVNDCIVKVNGVETVGLDLKNTIDLLKASGSTLNMVVKRRRPLSMRSCFNTVTWQLVNNQVPGLNLETGIYVSGITPGSLSAHDGSISLGDRLISVNGQSISSMESAQSQLGMAFKSGSGNSITLCFLRCGYPSSSSPPSSCSSGHNLLEKVDMALAFQLRNNNNSSVSPTTVKSSPEDASKKASVCLVSSAVQTETTPMSPLNKGIPFDLPTSQPSSSSSSSSRGQLPVSEPQATTLLDRAYHKIFGERRREGKKPLLSSSIRHHHHHHHHSREDDYEAIAELDSVLDDYTQTLNSKPPISKSSKRKESNGGTWPKYKGVQCHLAEATGTVTSLQPHKRKERKPLASITKQHFYEMKGKNDISHNHSSKVNYSMIGGEHMTVEQAPRTLPRSRERMTLFVPSPEPSLSGGIRSSGGGENQLVSPPPPPRISSSGSSSYTSPDCGSPQKVPLGCHSNDHLVGSAPRIHYSGATSPESCLDYSVVSAHRDKDVLEYYKNRNRPRPKSAHYVLSDSECLSSLDSSLSCCKPLTASPTHHYEHHRLPYSHSEATTPLSDRLLTSRNSDLAYQPTVTSSALSVGYLRSNLPFYPMAGQRHSHIHHPIPSQSGLCHSPTVGGNHHVVGGSGMAIPANSSRYSSPPSLSIFTSRSGDSLLSGSESATDAPRSYSSRLGHGDGGRHSMKDSGRYSFTPSPSPCPSSQFSYSGPSPTASMDIPSSHFHPIRRLVPSHHTHHLHHSPVSTSFRPVDPAIEHYGFESGGTATLPKRSQRIRIPSNPSVASKSSGGKLSTSSIEKSASVSERSSPLPAFTIEWLNADGTHPIATDYRGRKPEQGDLRNIYIEKSQEPLGIQISCGKGGGGIFVSSITDNSLAAQVGLQVGDQLLEVCGINMRSATYQLAANVLRQCGNSITMLVQYNPDKYEEAVLEMSSSSNEEDDEEEEEEEEDDEDDSDSDSPLHTPAASPKTASRNANGSNANQVVSVGSSALTTSLPASGIMSTGNLSMEDISSSATSTLTKQKVASHNHEKSSSSSSGHERDPQQQQQQQQQQQNQSQKGSPTILSSSSSSSNSGDPRLLVLKKSTSHLGISLLGGNAVGIFVHSLQEDSPAGGNNGLRTGDQILEYNGVDLRQATAEEAAYELAKPADQITVLVQYNVSKYSEIQDLPGDSFYVRALVDRSSVDGSLAFRKDDILFIDNTMFNGVPGLWRAWLVDQEGQKVKCGFVPSKYKLEEELMMKRSLGDLDGDGGSRRGSTSARRSFFRRRKHQRSHSRDSSSAKELASFSDVSINSCSDSGNLAGTEDLIPPTYLKVERLDYLTMRPVILVGPLMEVVVDKLEQDFPHLFQRCIPEVMRGSQQMMERGLLELKLVDYRRRGSHFECTTLNAVREICHKNCHALLDVCLSAAERLHRCQIYPIVIFLKFRSVKQIREVKDSRYLTEKVTTKAAKEMHEHSLKIESEHKHLINAVIPGSNLAYMCTQVKMCVEEEQSKTLWVPCQSSSAQSLHNNNTSSSTTF